MSNTPRQPQPDDAVLGGQSLAPIDGAVLGGIQGLRERLLSTPEKKEVLYDSLKYGNQGIDLLFQILENESNEDIQWLAYHLLAKQPDKELRDKLKSILTILLEKTIHSLSLKAYFKERNTSAIDQQELINFLHFLFLTDRGKIYRLTEKNISSIPSLQLSISTLYSAINEKEPEIIRGQIFCIPDLGDKKKDLLVVTTKGNLKRLPELELFQLGHKGQSIITLKNNEKLHSFQLVNSRQHLILLTSSGRILRFLLREDRIPVMNFCTHGLSAIRLRSNEYLVAILALDTIQTIFLITRKGYAKECPIEGLRIGNLGDIGVTIIQFHDKDDCLFASMPAKSQGKLKLITNLDRQLIVPIQQIPLQSRDSYGEKMLELHQEEYLTKVLFMS